MAGETAGASWRIWLRGAWQRVELFFLGTALSWVLVPHMLAQRKELERMFVLECSARLLGVPLLPGTYSLRLLPYMVPLLLYWRRRTVFDDVLEGADLKHLGH